MEFIRENKKIRKKKKENKLSTKKTIKKNRNYLDLKIFINFTFNHIGSYI